MLKGQDEKETQEKDDVGWDVVKNRFQKRKENKSAGRIMNIKDNDDKEIWEKIDAIIDSGAVDTIGGRIHAKGCNIRKTKTTGYKYKAVGDSPIVNEGEFDIEGVSQDGIKVKLTPQIGDKCKDLLIAVSRMAEQGNMVIFNADMKALKELAKKDSIAKDVIVSNSTGLISEMTKKRGLYTYPIWVKRNKAGKKDDDKMEVGAVGNSDTEDEWGLF